MEKNEKLQKLAEEEKVFNCIMSYRHSKAAVVNDLQKFYKKGATLTAWQLQAIAICLGETDCERLILPAVIDIDITPSFVKSYVDMAYEGIHSFYDFFKKHKKNNSDLKYPSLDTTGIAILINKKEWDWLFDTTFNLKWGPLLAMSINQRKENDEYCATLFNSICDYLYRRLDKERFCNQFGVSFQGKELKSFIKACVCRNIISSKQRFYSLVLPNLKAKFSEADKYLEPLVLPSIQYLETSGD